MLDLEIITFKKKESKQKTYKNKNKRNPHYEINKDGHLFFSLSMKVI